MEIVKAGRVLDVGVDYLMDELDCQILEALQNEFPLTEKPYQIVAEKLAITSEELGSRVERLMADGVIRRIGASLDSRKLGFSSTLAALSVEDELVERAAKVIEQYPEVTHSYLRDDEFNIWFTVIAADKERIEEILEQIRNSVSLEKSRVLNVPVKRLFKLDARFKVQD